MFVVIGEQGEYSDRSEWICGVYETREKAEEAMVRGLEKRRIFDAWHDAVQNHRKTIDPKGPFNWRFPLSPEDNILWNAMMSEAERRAGPKPEYEAAERVALYELPLNEWQSQSLEELKSIGVD